MTTLGKTVRSDGEAAWETTTCKACLQVRPEGTRSVCSLHDTQLTELLVKPFRLDDEHPKNPRAPSQHKEKP